MPGVLGHEGAGTVVAVGDGVHEYAENDPVVIGWPSCDACRNCRIVGILGGSGRSRELMTTIMQLYAHGRFPSDRLVQYFELADVQEALDKSYAGEVIKPILRMPA